MASIQSLHLWKRLIVLGIIVSISSDFLAFIPDKGGAISNPYTGFVYDAFPISIKAKAFVYRQGKRGQEYIFPELRVLSPLNVALKDVYAILTKDKQAATTKVSISGRLKIGSRFLKFHIQTLLDSRDRVSARIFVGHLRISIQFRTGNSFDGLEGRIEDSNGLLLGIFSDKDLKYLYLSIPSSSECSALFFPFIGQVVCGGRVKGGILVNLKDGSGFGAVYAEEGWVDYGVIDRFFRIKIEKPRKVLPIKKGQLMISITGQSSDFALKMRSILGFFSSHWFSNKSLGDILLYSIEEVGR